MLVQVEVVADNPEPINTIESQIVGKPFEVTEANN